MTIKLIAYYRQENNGFFFLFAFCFFWVEDNLIFLKKSYSKLDVLNILSEGNTHQTTKTAETNWTDFYQFGNDIRYSRQGEQDIVMSVLVFSTRWLTTALFIRTLLL